MLITPPAVQSITIPSKGYPESDEIVTGWFTVSVIGVELRTPIESEPLNCPTPDARFKEIV